MRALIEGTSAITAQASLSCGLHIRAIAARRIAEPAPPNVIAALIRM